ncbi:expressed hypothetical protein [Trichoplax adhaerens]|uniref:Protein Churchill n=1 Tax=Trichoplax adhaerens TaxID=10228 RepID=B3S6F8_TRIAD|nr:expressed hypothetical protein [Trichoplax adhaerens]EDV21614.1 expressed hypothetical protein [Trichoplax adhaerens]|eukprot:XP_002115762.1 expressed hypothetical protein [Trichoplax adhaerens]
MCNRCVFTPFPDRGNSCLDTGSFFLNFKACSSCQKRTLIETCNKESKEEEDQTEVIKYQHICPNCRHVIANHEYTFQVEEGYQIYGMECLLCGCGEATVSVMPNDPRKLLINNGY